MSGNELQAVLDLLPAGTVLAFPPGTNILLTEPVLIRRPLSLSGLDIDYRP